MTIRTRGWKRFAGALACALIMQPGLVAAQATTLTYVGWSQDEAASKPTLTAMFEGFQKANPGVKLDVIGYPWAQMQQNLVLRLRSNQPLSVAQMQERWLPTFAALDNLVDLNDVYGKANLEQQINPGLLRLGQIGGKQLGLPWTAGSIGMVANLKVLKDAGIAAPPTTVDEFVAALRAIKKAQPQSVPYALMTKNNSSMSPEFQVWLWTFGGQLFDERGNVKVASPAAVKALTFMTDLVRENLAAKDIDRPDARRLFAQFQTAFYNDAPLARGFARNNSGQGAAFDANVGAMATPVARAGEAPQSLAWGHLLVLLKPASGTLNADSPAAKFAAHLALNTASELAYFKDVGLFPVTNDALAAVAADPYATNWSRNARTSRRDETSNWANAADLTTIVGEEVQGALLGQKSPQAAIDAMASRLEPRMREVRPK
ncbi:MAG: sugar ABC transporter substrate-binding protein [Betaproteobacteria bacterium]|nr:sugar ABC transporter substrate-binding protein [Betaproteobacteria bacterium]